MPQTGGKPKVSKAPKKSSSLTTKRNFTVVMGNKEHGLYVSSSPSSAARKAVSKLCATDKKRKVQFSIREITQGSKKKTYGPYSGYIEKLKEPIELKGRVIKYKPVAKLSGKTGAKKGGMRGGGYYYKKLIVKNIEIANDLKDILEKSISQITVDIKPYTNSNANFNTNSNNANSNAKFVLVIETKKDIFLNIRSEEKEKIHIKLREDVDKKLKESENDFKIMKHWRFESNGANTNYGQSNNN